LAATNRGTKISDVYREKFKTHDILDKKFMIRIACCQYAVEVLPHWKAYTQKMQRWVEDAKNHGANILLLPEYAGLEVATASYPSARELFAAIQDLLPQYLDFHQALAQEYQIYVQPGTIPVAVEEHQYVNRAYFFGPHGTFDYQDKLHLVEFEKASNLMQPGKGQKVFDTTLGKIGIAICYDTEFPEVIRKLTAAGAILILVPSYTITLAGYHRVVFSGYARAIENQIYVAISSMVGEMALSHPVEHSTGQAFIVGPADRGFSDNGIIAVGRFNQTDLIKAELSPGKIMEVRTKGEVRNFEDSKKYMDQQEALPLVTI
jgi:predicted amidohydrolase